MRALLITAIIALFAGTLSAQRFKLDINTETPEGQLLQQIGQEADEAKRLQLLEQFSTQYAKHDSLPWVYSQMQTAYMKAGQHDKALQVGEKLAALAPQDLETAHNNLKSAEARKDAELIRKWAAQTSDLARKVAESPKPSDEGDVEAWKQRVDFAKQLDTYTEYALFAAAAQSMNEPPKVIALVETIEKRNPKSPYLDRIYGAYVNALKQTGALDKAIGNVEKAVAAGNNSEDALLQLADYYSQRKNPEKAVLYAEKIIETLPAKPKPEGLSDADWEKKKNLTIGVAHWIAGVTHATQNKFPQADKSLRAALPLISGDQQMLGAAAFHLGVANYKMGQANKNKAQVQEALKFSQQSAGIKSAYQGLAAKNVAAIKADPLAR